MSNSTFSKVVANVVKEGPDNGEEVEVLAFAGEGCWEVKFSNGDTGRFTGAEMGVDYDNYKKMKRLRGW